MNEINDVLVSMRKSFSFLWDQYGFKFVGLMPKSGYHDYGYFAQLENEWCKLAFQSESGYLEDIGVVPKGVRPALSSGHVGVSQDSYVIRKEVEGT